MEQIKTQHLVWQNNIGQSVQLNGSAEPSKLLGRHLRGPIPWDWVVQASMLPGKALVVGLCLWRISGATKSKTVVLANSELEPFGVGRSAKTRALAALKDAGLIRTERCPGRWSQITLLAGVPVRPI
jgi:DNA-binding transcriptional ArsR family regulator